MAERRDFVPDGRDAEFVEKENIMAQAYIVSGMTCGGCARSVTNAIMAKDSSAKVDVDLVSGTVKVDGALTTDQVRDAVEGAGFEFKGAA